MVWRHVILRCMSGTRSRPWVQEVRVRMLARHVKWLHSLSPTPSFLFPARKKTGKNSWRPNSAKPMASPAFVRLIRLALVEVCGLPWDKARKFTMHALRVGGINYYRRLGVPLETRAQLADHLSLPSAVRYQRLAPHEQIDLLTQAVRKV